jgi:hypothetical protein
LIEGVYFEGVFEKSSMMDFSISTYLSGVKRMHATIKNNKDRQLYYRFKRPVFADKLQVDIQSDNGHHNVAMTAVMPIRSRPIRAPITNLCNHRNAHGSYLINDAFDHNEKTRFIVRCDGFVTIPKTDTKSILSIDAVDGQNSVQVKYSKDLRHWRNLGKITPSVPKARSLKVPAHVYTRIDLPTSLGGIDGIHLESVASSSIGARKTPFRMGVIAHD